jgi:hypothetical protein
MTILHNLAKQVFPVMTRVVAGLLLPPAVSMMPYIGMCQPIGLPVVAINFASLTGALIVGSPICLAPGLFITCGIIWRNVYICITGENNQQIANTISFIKQIYFIER